MTKTRVIHIREARGATDEVYIGRAGKGHDGYFGNPFQIGRDGSRAEVIEKCRKYLVDRIASDPKFRERVRNLHGKTLTCFYKPAPVVATFWPSGGFSLRPSCPWRDGLSKKRRRRYR